MRSVVAAALASVMLASGCTSDGGNLGFGDEPQPTAVPELVDDLAFTMEADATTSLPDPDISAPPSTTATTAAAPADTVPTETPTTEVAPTVQALGADAPAACGPVMEVADGIAGVAAFTPATTPAEAENVLRTLSARLAVLAEDSPEALADPFYALDITYGMLAFIWQTHGWSITAVIEDPGAPAQLDRLLTDRLERDQSAVTAWIAQECGPVGG